MKMISAKTWLTVPNARAIPLALVPEFSFSEFRQAILHAPAQGKRVVALFARPMDSVWEWFAVLATDAAGLLEVAKAYLNENSYCSLTPPGSFQLFWQWFWAN